MQQIARNVTDAEERFLRGVRYLLVNRAPLYTEAFRSLLGDFGVDVKRMPPKSPNLRPHAGCFVRSIKEEYLSRMILLDERHLRRAVKEYAFHYHTERNHQGLNNELIIGNHGCHRSCEVPRTTRGCSGITTAKLRKAGCYSGRGVYNSPSVICVIPPDSDLRAEPPSTAPKAPVLSHRGMRGSALGTPGRVYVTNRNRGGIARAE